MSIIESLPPIFQAFLLALLTVFSFLATLIVFLGAILMILKVVHKQLIKKETTQKGVFPYGRKND